jgi:hypothetical protein
MHTCTHTCTHMHAPTPTHTSKIDRVLSDEYTGIALHRPSSTSSLSQNLQNKLDIFISLQTSLVSLQTSPPWSHFRASLVSLQTSTVSSDLPSDLPGLASDLPGLASDLPGLASDLPGLSSDLPGLASDLPGLASDLPGLTDVNNNVTS